MPSRRPDILTLADRARQGTAEAATAAETRRVLADAYAELGFASIEDAERDAELDSPLETSIQRTYDLAERRTYDLAERVELTGWQRARKRLATRDAIEALWRTWLQSGITAHGTPRGRLRDVLCVMGPGIYTHTGKIMLGRPAMHVRLYYSSFRFYGPNNPQGAQASPLIYVDCWRAPFIGSRSCRLSRRTRMLAPGLVVAPDGVLDSSTPYVLYGWW